MISPLNVLISYKLGQNNKMNLYLSMLSDERSYHRPPVNCYLNHVPIQNKIDVFKDLITNY